MQDELAFLPLAEMARRLEARATSSEAIVRAVIDRTERLEPTLNTYVTFFPERALEQAWRADREIAAGSYRGPLHGVPVTVKDLFDTKDMPTSAGAAFLREHVPDEDAALVRRLREAGAVLMGKANLNKFAGGESGDNPDFGRIRNPWSPRYSAGGSSGGSGAQVAAGLAALSLGSDNGGSTRIPAALCGIVGLKPTHGRLSMEGMFPRAYTLDHPGLLTRTVEDCAIALDVLGEHRAGDTTTAAPPAARASAREALGRPATGVRVGVDRDYVRLALPSVREAFDEALAVLEGLGARLVDVSIPSPEEMTAVMYTLFFCEWGAAHEPWLRERPEEYGEGGSRAALLVPAVDYIKASQRRRALQADYARATRDVDVLASPTYPLDRRPFDHYPPVDGRPLRFEDALRYTLPFDLLGLPAVSVPCGFSELGMPIGLQLVGKPWRDAALLGLAHAYEQATPWHTRHP